MEVLLCMQWPAVQPVPHDGVASRQSFEQRSGLATRWVEEVLGHQLTGSTACMHRQCCLDEGHRCGRGQARATTDRHQQQQHLLQRAEAELNAPKQCVTSRQVREQLSCCFRC